MPDHLQHSSQTNAAAADASGPSATLVNFIWINKDKTTAAPDNPSPMIEMQNIRNAVDNANKYPDADFRLWIDLKLMDEYTAFCIERFIDENAEHGNIALRDLQEIPDYVNDSLFTPPSSLGKGGLSRNFNIAAYVKDRKGPGNVYSRADYARILVLDHCMETERKRGRIIYSDIDCPDVRLPEAEKLIDKYGVAMHDLSIFVPSHGYIGLNANMFPVRNHLRQLKYRTSEAAHKGHQGFRAFEIFLGALGMPNAHYHSVIGLKDLLPEMEIVPPHLDYAPPYKDFKKWQKMQRAQAAPQI